jgi:uncharacterized membrane protein YeiH
MNLIYTIDLVGTFVFAISGVLTATKQKFDIFGAVGGGTLRDMLIGSQPVGWMLDTNYVLIIGLAVPASFFLRKYIQKLRRTMFLFDAIGIGLFTILGMEKTLEMGISPVIAVIMGTVSAVFGGVVRDVLCNVVPLIFRGEIYATACFSGAILYLGFKELALDYHLSMVLTIVFIIVLRVAAVKRHWKLPEMR